MMMKSGLLWYDSDARKSALDKIDEAVERYVEKFGVQPNACHVTPGVETAHDSVAVVPNRWLRPGYFWLGVDEELPQPGPRRSRRDSEAIAVAPSPGASRRQRRSPVAPMAARRAAAAGA
jgi:hypothetical protein